MFEKSYKLYSVFWALNLDMVKVKDIKKDDSEVLFVDEKGNKKGSASLFSKLGVFVQKAIDCCKE